MCALAINTQVDGYVSQVERLVTQCALAKSHEETSDVFLWSAWRCLEAMLRALLVPYPPRRFNELTVKGLLDDAFHRTIIPVDHQQAFENVWRYSRTAARVREYDQPDYLDLVPECSTSLAKSVKWFFERSSAKGDMSPEVEEGLEVLTSDIEATSREQMSTERQALLHKELVAILAERRSRLEELKHATEHLATAIEAEGGAVEAADERATKLGSKLTEMEGYPLYSVPSSQALSSSNKGGGGWRVPIALVVGLVVGGALGSLLGIRSPSGGDETGEGVSGYDEIRGGGVDDEAGLFVGGDAAGYDVRSDQASASLDMSDESGSTGLVGTRCPDGMLEFEPERVRLIQPYPRRSWPAGPKSLPNVDVGRFCLDREPVLVANYEQCAAQGVCRPRIECLDQPRNYPVNCVKWADAQNYCRWRGGTLPSVAQWERTLLQVKVRTEPAVGTWEWVLDPFPAEVFKRGATKRADDGTIWGYMALQKQFVPSKGTRRMCSWHKAPASAKRGNLSFRCAIELRTEP